MDDIAGVILENLLVCHDFYRCRIGLTKPIGKVSPGQFVMLKIPSADVFLRRPFSIYEYGHAPSNLDAAGRLRARQG